MEEASDVTSQPDSEYHAADGTGIGDQDSADQGEERDLSPGARLVPQTEAASDDDSTDFDSARASTRAAEAHAETVSSESHPEAAAAAAAEVDAVADPARVSTGAEWHDIQAMFVDDPRRSVQSAAEKADAAVSALTDLLHRRRLALAAADAGAPNGPGETEELREMLRSYRIFCQSISDLGGQLQEAVPSR
jgi:hypothetical protein